jgi:hypothetical protein
MTLKSLTLTCALLLTAQFSHAKEAYPADANEFEKSSITREYACMQAISTIAAGLIQAGEVTKETPAFGHSVSRAQVQAKLHESIRLGLVAGGELRPIASQSQLDQIDQAAARARKALPNKIASRN